MGVMSQTVVSVDNGITSDCILHLGSFLFGFPKKKIRPQPWVMTSSRWLEFYQENTNWVEAQWYRHRELASVAKHVAMCAAVYMSAAVRQSAVQTNNKLVHARDARCGRVSLSPCPLHCTYNSTAARVSASSAGCLLQINEFSEIATSSKNTHIFHTRKWLILLH